MFLVFFFAFNFNCCLFFLIRIVEGFVRVAQVDGSFCHVFFVIDIGTFLQMCAFPLSFGDLVLISESRWHLYSILWWFVDLHSKLGKFVCVWAIIEVLYWQPIEFSLEENMIIPIFYSIQLTQVLIWICNVYRFMITENKY